MSPILLGTLASSGAAAALEATGGTITDISVDGQNYRVHTFNSSDTFEVTANTDDEVEFLVVAGGATGGCGQGAGGGAGGYRSSVGTESSGGGVVAESRLTFSPGSYSVVIGAGGASFGDDQRPGNPGNSSSLAYDGGTISALGGGRGGIEFANAGSGGSGGGGGANANRAGGSGTAGQGFDGGSNFDNFAASGGGGASEAGQNGGNNLGGDGGDGVASVITGTTTYRAGGGGGAGAGNENSNRGRGGLGGGTDGLTNRDFAGTDSSPANSGGASGGSRENDRNIGGGGSGVVIVRYKI